ncbi:MAG: 16S rRNA (adenine(1518)-N(6)/adenine(1519)-N(6))-dimethyltransferase RsmA [Bacteroidetes bacterium]|nr:16S rRNA (adenine(1518)-N(6)/adenine(1519)-N(6))-dimethyltransferase RsmA [Bacteroidota bacterium]
MKENTVKPKKSLGQHFLRDTNVLRKIVQSLNLRDGDIVVEIGAGDGALTRLLVEYPILLLAVEVDHRVIPLLQKEFGPRIRLYHQDIRTINISELCYTYRKQLRIVGNIPYYLTSSILFHLFNHHSAIVDATLMVQREVAQRIVAQPNSKAYGILSVVSQFYTDPTLLFTISRNVFYPKPTVNSALVRFLFRHTIADVNEALFLSIVKATFGKRRKTLKNSLQYFGLSPAMLRTLPLNLNRRPETLTLREFLQLTQHVSQLSQHGHE